uniref:CSON001465 protein n=1 Tax=Culicoides sonorensis TaxID=179676 RepID=A0A336KYD2_CULSO
MFDYNSYQNLISAFSTLLLDEKTKDVTFYFPESKKRIRAHKSLLVRASPVFCTMFNGSFIENTDVIIKDISPEAFAMLINGIYLRPTKLLYLDEADALYQAADKYDVIDLRNVSYDYFMKMCRTSNVFYLLERALMYSWKDLRVKCEHYFRTYAYLVLVEHITAKMHVSDSVLAHLLSLEGICIESEMELYQAIEILLDLGLLDSCEESIKKIRFLTMTIDEVKSCKLLTEAEKFKITWKLEGKCDESEVDLNMIDGRELCRETKSRLKIPYNGWIAFLAPMRIEFWLQVLTKCKNYDVTSHRLFNLTNIFQDDETPQLDQIIGDKKRSDKILVFNEDEKRILVEILGNHKISDTNHSAFLKELNLNTSKTS